MKTVAEEIREATREAHQAMKDLRHLMREAREERERTENAAITLTKEHIEATVEAELGKLEPLIKEWAHDLYDTLTSEATKMMCMALYGNEQGRGESIFDKVIELHENVNTALSRNKAAEAKWVDEGKDPDEVEVHIPGVNPRNIVGRKDRRRIEKKLKTDKAFRARIEAAMRKDGLDPDTILPPL